MVVLQIRAWIAAFLPLHLLPKMPPLLVCSLQPPILPDGIGQVLVASQLPRQLRQDLTNSSCGWTTRVTTAALVEGPHTRALWEGLINRSCQRMRLAYNVCGGSF